MISKFIDLLCFITNRHLKAMFTCDRILVIVVSVWQIWICRKSTSILIKKEVRFSRYSDSVN